MRFHVFIEFEKECGWYVVTCPALPGCVSQGRTEQEAAGLTVEQFTQLL